MPIQRRPVPRAKVEQLVANAIAAQDRARQARSYTVIGRLYTLETEEGRIQFDRTSGPGIAQEVDEHGDFTGQLLFIGAWDKLPPVKEYSEEFCPACLDKCDVCAGSGLSLCTLVGCGGRGAVPDGEDPCLCTEKTQRPDPACGVCNGYGGLPKTKPCPSCHGKGQAACAVCRGTGKRPTGKDKDGKTMCPECHGSQRAGAWKQQSLETMISGRIGSNLVIGPVLKLILTPAQTGEGKPSNAFLRISPQRDRSGQPMLVLLPPGEAIAPYLFGGSVQ